MSWHECIHTTRIFSGKCHRSQKRQTRHTYKEEGCSRIYFSQQLFLFQDGAGGFHPQKSQSNCNQLCTVTDIQDTIGRRVPLFRSAILSHGIAVVRSTNRLYCLHLHSEWGGPARLPELWQAMARGGLLFDSLISCSTGFPAGKKRRERASGQRGREAFFSFKMKINKI